MVSNGKLPPLEERLPDNPVVVEPVERSGVYGGTWRTTLLGLADGVWMKRTVGHEHLLRWNPEFTGIIPNVAETYEANDDGTSYTFHLRKGMKWSDGEPYTADDLIFAQNDVLNNQELYPAEPNPPTAAKVDDYTVEISFKEPWGVYLLDLADFDGQKLVRLPFHYLKRFHPDFNPDIDSVMEEEGAADWVALFQEKAGLAGSSAAYWENPELPTIYPWRTATPAGAGVRVVMERNPYYWKVDTEGRQLPYLDRVSFDVVNNADVILLKAMAGEIEMQDRHIGTPQNKPTLAANRDTGDYDFFETVPTDMNTTGIAFNLTHKDPVKREIFNNKDFRIGLSLAMNRKEIIDTVFQGQGQPWQMAPRPETRFHNERLATQYTEYDTELANEHLDLAGYTERDSDEFRLGPDGARIRFRLNFITSWTPEWADVAELLKAYWAEVGIDMSPNVQDRSLFLERAEANDFDAKVFAGEGGGEIDTMLDPGWYLPSSSFGAPSPPWDEWYESQGAEGEEPPEPVRRQLELYDQLLRTADEDQRVEYMKEILDICAELFHSIGVSLTPPGYGIVKNNFHNVPATMPAAGAFYNPGPTNPEQYFMS